MRTGKLRRSVRQQRMAACQRLEAGAAGRSYALHSQLRHFLTQLRNRVFFVLVYSSLVVGTLNYFHFKIEIPCRAFQCSNSEGLKESLRAIYCKLLA